MNKKEAKKLIDDAAAGRQSLLEPEAKALVSAWGIEVPRSVLIREADDLATKAEEVSPPFVLKVVSSDILHKRDVGGVITNLKDGEKASIALAEMRRGLAERIPQARVEGFLLEETVPKGIELIIGGLRDPQFGPAVMFGTGGIAVELTKDVSFRLAPLSREEVLGMMREVKSYPLLTGFRGSKPVDMEKLFSVVRKVSDILLEIEKIRELEINPLIVSERAVAADVRVLLISDS